VGWALRIDVLVLEPLNLSQLDYVGLSIREALIDVKLPAVIATPD